MSLILLKVLLTLYAAQSRAEKSANCNEDVSLACPGADSSQFFSVVWYKLHKGRKEGLIMKQRSREEPFVYSSPLRVAFGKNYSLTLLSVTPEDSGSYQCALNANIGGQNLYVTVDLVVHVCVTQASTVMTTNRPTDVEHRQDAAEELPLVWSLVGCGALSLLKVLLSLVTVLVIRAVPCSRRRSGGVVFNQTAGERKRMFNKCCL